MTYCMKLFVVLQCLLAICSAFNQQHYWPSPPINSRPQSLTNAPLPRYATSFNNIAQDIAQLKFSGSSDADMTRLERHSWTAVASKIAKSSPGGKEVSVYLLSFPNLYVNNCPSAAGSNNSPMNNLLKDWKEYCLGDGGVYFDQRPKALRALNTLLADAIMTHIGRDLAWKDYNPNILVETAVISTCARFEILVAVEWKGLPTNCQDRNESITTVQIGDFVSSAIVSSIARQIMLQQKRISYMIQRRLPFNILDRPSRIKLDLPSSIANEEKDLHDNYVRSLKHDLLFTQGDHDVIERICLIAAGLQDRLIFRPFSARDSHIMQQLKRTSEVAASLGAAYLSKKKASPPSPSMPMGASATSSTYCKILFDAALQSGKAARSSKVVPILDELRELSKGADGPPELSAIAAESAKTLAVAPVVAMCVSKLQAMKASTAIQEMRDRARYIAKEANIDFDDNAGREIRRMLHIPTMKLREGQLVNVEKVMKEVEAMTMKLNSSNQT